MGYKADAMASYIAVGAVSALLSAGAVTWALDRLDEAPPEPVARAPVELPPPPAPPPPSTAPSGAPNVIFIVWDTVRADRLSLYGGPRPTTPHLAKYAEHAAVWTQAISPSYWTVPAHASLFTGLPVRTHGCDALNPWLRDARTTMAEWFHDHGWATWAFSANPNIGPQTNLVQGFDVVEGQERPAGGDRPSKDAGEATREALFHRIDAEKDRPFLAYLNLMEAHSPRAPSMEARKAIHLSPQLIAEGEATSTSYAATKAANRGEKPYTEEQDAAILGVYDASVWELDRLTSAIVDEVARRGLAEQTLVVVVSDHGDAVGEHGVWGHNATIYDPLVHVPLVLWGPGVPEGRRTAPVSTADVFPTLARLSGIPLADPPGDLIDGPRTPVVAELTAGRGVRPGMPDRDSQGQIIPQRRRFTAIYDGDWKLIRSSADELELYDRATDPGETTNLASQEPDRSAALARALDAWQAATPLPPTGPLPEDERKRRRDADHEDAEDQ